MDIFNGNRQLGREEKDQGSKGGRGEALLMSFKWGA